VIGAARYRDLNTLLAERLGGPRPLAVSHRGSSRGGVVENTSAAVRAALAEGADIVEIDVSRSRDGDYFCFHDGTERHHFGLDANIATLTTAQIETLCYRPFHPRRNPRRVEPLSQLLAGLPAETILNVDRSWDHWPDLFALFESVRNVSPQQLLLKSPAHPAVLRALAEHPVKYPYAPIVTTAADAHRVLDIGEINTVAVEVLAAEKTSELLDPTVLATITDRGVVLMANAEVMASGAPLFAGYDDDLAIMAGPDAGWGPFLRLGIDLVLTDWPGLLAAYRAASADRPAEVAADRDTRSRSSARP